MQGKKTITLGLAAMLVAGCAETWVKPGGDQQQFNAMEAACTRRAYEHYPPLMRLVQMRDAYTTPVTTRCDSHPTGGGGMSSNCETTGGQYVPPAMAELDDNQDSRDKDKRDCFFENGWRPKED